MLRKINKGVKNGITSKCQKKEMDKSGCFKEGQQK